MSEFKSMLKYLRERSGMSQAELAKKLGISKSTVGMYELGRREPDFETMEAIADIFNVDMNFLYGKKYSENDSYYTNPETAALAQELLDNPDLRMLFDAARDVKPENLQLAAEMLKRMKETNPDG